MPIVKGKWARHRLGGQKNFARVFAGKHSAADSRLVIYALANDLPQTRLGLSVGRRCGHAVTRSRLKRWLREAFRLAYDELPQGFDLICIPRPGQIKSLESCVSSLRAVAARAVKRYETSRRGSRGSGG